MKWYCFFILMVLLCFIPNPISAREYVTIDIADAGPVVLENLKNTPGLLWWVELEDELLALVDDGSSLSLDAEQMSFSSITPDPDRLAFITLPIPKTLRAFVLASGGRFAVIQKFPEEDRHKPQRKNNLTPGHDHGQGEIYPFQPNVILAQRLENGPVHSIRAKRAETQTLVNELSPHRWFMDVFDLHCFNRYTHGSEIEDARDWLVERFNKLPGVSAYTQALTVNRPETTVTHNVIAVLEGTLRPENLFIIGAHYDSTSQSAKTLAPGAEDNASGVAALLEMARVFSLNPPEETLIFVCFTGEEQGLFGSQFHAQSLLDSGDNGRVTGMLNMDMIAFTEDNDFDILLETDGSGQFMLNALGDAAANYTNLRIITSLNPFGSDHVPYLQANMPAVLVIENDWNRYPAYHRANDTIEWLEMDQGWEVLKMNMAAIAELIR